MQQAAQWNHTMQYSLIVLASLLCGADANVGFLNQRNRTAQPHSFVADNEPAGHKGPCMKKIKKIFGFLVKNHTNQTANTTVATDGQKHEKDITLYDNCKSAGCPEQCLEVYKFCTPEIDDLVKRNMSNVAKCAQA